jgi:hypothetical protein
VPRDATGDVKELTQTFVDALVKDYKEANPSAMKKKKK